MQAAPSNFNRSELLADVSEDFEQVETAISTASPERCRRFVSPELYEQLVGTVSDLTAQGHRRVHGAFEILSAEVLTPESGVESPSRAPVRLHATSSLEELDRHGRVVQGSETPMAWTQDLVASREEATGRWIIRELGPMTVNGPVTGPSGQPIESAHPMELERRDRDSEEHGNAFVTATLNFLNPHYHGV